MYMVCISLLFILDIVAFFIIIKKKKKEKALIQEKENGRQKDGAVAILQLPAYPPSEISLLKGLRICLMLPKKSVSGQWAFSAAQGHIQMI